ncbi:hypothetical protein GUJ93_ZPchr0011g28039 [Zizania palustris]|uniref:Uncharacterized protein n=1 Tax=Zizania palustris TaxID=103762 RepID=A0A8J5WH69_ZIZPA|nr:hypothetical protein GUJ93_ZPchr0011g28039 [Zizania palustris]
MRFSLLARSFTFSPMTISVARVSAAVDATYANFQAQDVQKKSNHRFIHVLLIIELLETSIKDDTLYKFHLINLQFVSKYEISCLEIL